MFLHALLSINNNKEFINWMRERDINIQRKKKKKEREN